MLTEIEVLIVGAGPAGLTMAIMLERYGIPFRIIDKKIKPVKTSNALAVHARTMEAWDDLGLLPRALAEGLILKHLVVQSGDKKILDLNLSLMDSIYPFVLCLSQYHTEQMMIDYLKSKNVNVEMQIELIDFDDKEDKINITLLHNDNVSENIRANWMIACDGIHSMVREKLSFTFKGKDLPQQFFLSDLEMESEIPRDQLNAFTSHNGILFLIPYSKAYWRMITDVTDQPKYHEASNVTKDEIQQMLAERCPVKIEIKNLLWKSEFHIHERLISTFNHKRIFLLGDSAHVHSPAGGQGMNTGIQDAYNLGWKLALVIQGKLKSSILETYTQERQPAAKEVISKTSLLTRIATMQNPFLLNIRNFLMSLITKSKLIQKITANNLGELTVKYTKNELNKIFSSIQGPNVGNNMPSNTQLLNVTRDKKFILLIFMGLNEDNDLISINHAIQNLKPFSDLVKLVLIRTKNNFEPWGEDIIFDESKLLHQQFSAKNFCFYLIRPDKYIAAKGKLEDLNKLTDYFR